ncbi:MAG: ribbon-helix-helix domain-containing protein [Fischerella sp. CENA71]|nr:ribbon-helix-helix domain-containing protein [Fischerella sp. CENA71]
MSTKKRKSLDDALASEFVYGTQQEKIQPQLQPEVEPEQQQPIANNSTQPEQEQEPAPAVKPISTQQVTKPNIMSQLYSTTPKEPTVRLTVDLTESMHRKLSLLAAKTGRKKAEIVRLLLDEALKEVEE